jgi:hypothetical protein
MKVSTKPEQDHKADARQVAVFRSWQSCRCPESERNLAFILTFAGIVLIGTAFGVFTELRTGSGWEIPSSLRLPIAFACAAMGSLSIFIDLRHWWQTKNYLALAVYPGLAILVIFIVVRQL